MISEDCYCCVATYKMKKKDIIMVRATEEEEIIANPNSVELLRCDFIRYSESLGATYAQNWMREKREEDGKSYRSWQYNESKVFDIFNNVVKRFYDGPDWLQQRITDPHNQLLEGNAAVRVRWNAIRHFLKFDRRGEIEGEDALYSQLEGMKKEEIDNPNVYKELIEQIYGKNEDA